MKDWKMSVIALVIILILGFAFLSWRKSETHDALRNNPKEYEDEIYEFVMDNKGLVSEWLEDEFEEEYQRGYQDGLNARK